MKIAVLVGLALVALNAALRIIADVATNPVPVEAHDVSTFLSWNGALIAIAASLAYLIRKTDV